MTEREIFIAALERREQAEQATYLDQACGGNTTLRQRVEALLRSYSTAPDFMDVPVGEQLASKTNSSLDLLAQWSFTVSPGLTVLRKYFSVLLTVKSSPGCGGFSPSSLAKS